MQEENKSSKTDMDKYRVPDIDKLMEKLLSLMECEVSTEDMEQREREILEDLCNIPAEKREITIEQRKRYAKVVNVLKKRYKNKCQIERCGFTFRKKSGDFYSEGHHLIPLSENGSQTPGNIAILCPNHHKMLHYANIEIGELGRGKRKVIINGIPDFIVY